MKLAKSVFRGLAVGSVAVAITAATVSTAVAFDPRVPQVGFSSASLQGYLNGVGESINVLTAQVDGQVWNSSVSGNATFTLMIELTANAANNAIGIYNTGGPVNPPLFNIFPGTASAGWFATTHFGGGNLTVTLFNQLSVIQGQITYGGVNPNGFGFYITSPSGTWYSQDARNTSIGGAARILTYMGTGNNFGDWWECFEESNIASASADFDDAVLLLQSVVPTPANASTWGSLKSLYRQ